MINIFKPSQKVFAHCDVPCGVYDPKPAQIAAATVLKMVEKILALPKEMSQAEMNSFVRMVEAKEEHARICKQEILVLWTDFFKPEHLEKFPELHEKVWVTSKLVSENKQHVHLDAAQRLVKSVDEIASIFDQIKAGS